MELRNKGKEMMLNLLYDFVPIDFDKPLVTLEIFIVFLLMYILLCVYLQC